MASAYISNAFSNLRQVDPVQASRKFAAGALRAPAIACSAIAVACFAVVAGRLCKEAYFVPGKLINALHSKKIESQIPDDQSNTTGETSAVGKFFAERLEVFNFKKTSVDLVLTGLVFHVAGAVLFKVTETYFGSAPAIYNNVAARIWSPLRLA